MSDLLEQFIFCLMMWSVAVLFTATILIQAYYRSWFLLLLTPFGFGWLALWSSDLSKTIALMIADQ